MHHLWTFLLFFLSWNPRLSLTVNDTDHIWGVVGAEARLNATSEASTAVIPRIEHELHIGGFFDLNSGNGAGALSAALLAVEEINQDSRYLKDYRIVLHHHRSTKVGINSVLCFSYF